MKPTSSRYIFRPRGFSLIEILVVISIVVILMALSGFAVQGLLRGQEVTQAAEVIESQLRLARQTAAARNTSVWVTFYAFEDATTPGVTGIRALQLEEGPSNGQTIPVGKLVTLPDGIIVLPPEITPSANAPTVFPPLNNAASTPPGVPATHQWTNFAFHPDGSTTLGSGPWHLTLQKATDPGTPAANFATLAIEPATGKLTVYRP